MSVVVPSRTEVNRCREARQNQDREGRKGQAQYLFSLFVSPYYSSNRLELLNVTSDQVLPGGGLTELASAKIWVLEGKEVVRKELNEAIMKLLAPEHIARP